MGERRIAIQDQRDGLTIYWSDIASSPLSRNGNPSSIENPPSRPAVDNSSPPHAKFNGCELHLSDFSSDDSVDFLNSNNKKSPALRPITVLKLEKKSQTNDKLLRRSDSLTTSDSWLISPTKFKRQDSINIMKKEYEPDSQSRQSPSPVPGVVGRLVPIFSVSPSKQSPALSPITQHEPPLVSPIRTNITSTSAKDSPAKMVQNMRSLVDLFSSSSPPVLHPSQTNVASATPVDWSSSPTSHKVETLFSLGLTGLPKKQLHGADELVSVAYNDIKTTNLSMPLQSSSIPASALTPLSTSPSKNLPWNQTNSATRAAKIELRNISMKKRAFMTDANRVERQEEIEVKLRQQNQNLVHTDGNHTVPKLFLSNEQKRVLDMAVREGHNIFFTGAAGTGKSVLLHRMIDDLKRKFSPEAVAVTASTGLAACHIGGITLHSFAGIGLGKEDVNTLVKRVKRNRKSIKRWNQTKVLVIDEISMIDGELFDKLEEIARTVRKGRDSKSKPFGGIQIVITGDFFQLPPVVEKGRELKFTFEASTWPEVIDKTIVLQRVFRQKDNTFSSMLNEMRRGNMSAQTIRTFESLSRKPQIPNGISPTELFPLRMQVDMANSRQLQALGGNEMVYESVDTYNIPELKHMFNLDNLMAVSELKIKAGSQVMMIKNVDETLVNGSLGRVLGFMNENNFSLIENETEILSSQDVREILKGDNNKPNLEQEFDDVFGIPDEQTVESDRLNINWRRKRAKLNLLKHGAASSGGRLWPLVRFSVADGTTRDILVQPETWTLENIDGEVMSSRAQLPLILAWALSIHKAQGQTLEYVKVDLSRAFEKGQAYVAISRAVTLEGLQVLRFSRDKVMVHQKVIDFYDSLNSALPTDHKQEEEEEEGNNYEESRYKRPRQQLRLENFKREAAPSKMDYPTSSTKDPFSENLDTIDFDAILETEQSQQNKSSSAYTY